MRWFLIALALVSLAGCENNSPAKQLARCERQANRVYPSALRTLARNDDVQICMGINGYELDAGNPTCGANSPGGKQAACYVANHSVAQHY